jgi:hypothetical protein
MTVSSVMFRCYLVQPVAFVRPCACTVLLERENDETHETHETRNMKHET